MLSNNFNYILPIAALDSMLIAFNFSTLILVGQTTLSLSNSLKWIRLSRLIISFEYCFLMPNAAYFSFTPSSFFHPWHSQRGFMGTIAGDYRRRLYRKSPAIAGDLPKRIVGLCPLGRAWWLAMPKAIRQSSSLQLCSPKINSPN